MVIKIIYCGQWNYLPDALRAREILQEFDTIDVKLVESGGGIFDILWGEELLFSKDQKGRFPNDLELHEIGSHTVKNLL